MASLSKRLTSDAVVLALATAYFYCAGSAYYSGFLAALDLNPDLMSRDYSLIVFDGFIYSLYPFFLIFSTGAFFAWFFSFIIFPKAFDIFGRHPRAKKLLLRVVASFHVRSGDSDFIVKSKVFSLRLIYSVIFVLIFVFNLSYFQDNGRVEGGKILKGIIFGVAIPNVIINVNGSNKALHFLACGSQNCAGFDADSKSIYYFQRIGHVYIAPKISP